MRGSIDLVANTVVRAAALRSRTLKGLVLAVEGSSPQLNLVIDTIPMLAHSLRIHHLDLTDGATLAEHMDREFHPASHADRVRTWLDPAYRDDLVLITGISGLRVEDADLLFGAVRRGYETSPTVVLFGYYGLVRDLCSLGWSEDHDFTALEIDD